MFKTPFPSPGHTKSEDPQPQDVPTDNVPLRHTNQTGRSRLFTETVLIYYEQLKGKCYALPWHNMTFAGQRSVMPYILLVSQ
jgi:hypothetical protein